MSRDQEMLTLTQVAIRAGVSPSAVSNWRKRYPDFPQPLDGERFSKREIYAWLESRGKTPTVADSYSPATIQRAFSLARGRLSPDEALPPIATMVTLSDLGADLSVPDIDLTNVALICEVEHKLPRGCLTGPLDRLRTESPAMITQVAQAVAEAARKASAKDIFDEILGMAGGGRQTAETYTPSQAVELLCDLLPRQAESVLDLACGYGGLLMEAAETVGATRTVGYEVNGTAWALCVQRFLLHGRPIGELHLEDALAAAPRGFDAVIAHPPFGLRVPPESPAGMTLKSAGIPIASSDLAWVLTARNALAPNGTAVVLTTVTSTYQRAGAGIRHELVRSGALKAVISLPSRALAPTVASIGLAIWVLGSPTTDAKAVLMVNGGSAEDPKEVVKAFRQWRDDPQKNQAVPGFSITVPVLDLLVDDVDLNPAVATATPIDSAEALTAAASALETATDAWEALGSIPPAPSLRLIPGKTSLVRLTDVAKVTRPLHVRREDLSEQGDHPYVTGVSEGQLRTAGWLNELPEKAVRTQPGDVVLATTGRVEAVVDDKGGHVLGSSVWLVRPKAPFLEHPEVLALLLNSSRIQAQTSGTTVQRLRSPRDVAIARLDAQTLETLSDWMRVSANTRSRASDYLTALSDAERAIVDALDAGAESTKENA